MTSARTSSPPASPAGPAAPTAPAHPPTAVRPEIQGLRAVAVMLVLLYHLWPGRLRGGYVGVDVFFVISGFLITGNLLRETERHGRVRLADFWARRARRLLPAAFLVLVATGLGVLAWVPELRWQQFFKEIGAAGLYVENWSLARDSIDYLASSNAPSPVQHYWTLSAEEQFYLVWPLLVVLGLLLARLTGRRRTTSITAVLALAAVASLAFSLWQTEANPAVAYFSTLTRGWEFAAGALLACAGGRSLAGRWPQVAAAVSGAGLLVVLVCSLTFTDSTPMPGVAAVVVVAGAVAVILAGDAAPAWSPTRLLTWRPATWLGDISYSIYLWHWPLLVLLPYVLERPPGLLARVGVLVATILLAWATKVLVEDPVRRTRWLGLQLPGRALVATATAAAVLVALCAVPWWNVEQDTRRSAELARSLVSDAPRCFGAQSMDPRAEDCPNPDLAESLVPSVTAVSKDYANYPACEERLRQRPLRPCEFGPTDDDAVPHVAVIGDSHARAMMPALERLADQGLLAIDFYSAGGCVWAIGDPLIRTAEIKDVCVSLKASMQPLLERTATRYDFVVTTGWTNKTNPPVARPVDAMVAAWKPIADQGVPIVAVRDNPAAGDGESANPNTCLAEVSVAEANAACGLTRERNLDRFRDPFALAVDRTPGARLVDLSDFYCDGDSCPVVIGGVNVYRDNSHVSVTYARTMAPYYYRALVDAGVLRAR
ncbi:acyltransferase family protein [Nocardioides aurantiacus]|uniref:acyltransferase family protein n=1 Tax=Nocardioides aurantiacus TaxID=86796 RepID=UPI00403F2B49